MDLSDPTRAVVPTLDGAVLAVLAVAGKPLTVGQIAADAVRGSEIGVRRSLERLIQQGIVRATLMGRNQVHELNREHIAADAVMELAGLRNKLWAKFREEFDTWHPRPLYAAVFGSAARGDGDEDSDIDLLLVHPLLPGEPKPTRVSAGLAAALADALGEAVLRADEPNAAVRWEEQVDRLRDEAEAWTGNPLQVVDLSFHEWRRANKEHLRLLAEVDRDGVTLVKARGMSIWPTKENPDG